jgi:4'-phosphopantetheinyl transferase
MTSPANLLPSAPAFDGLPVAAAVLEHRAPAAAEPVARAWLADALGLAPDALALGRDARGRPYLPGGGARDCNWSHSGERLLVGLASAGRVGVDLERLRPRPRALELARRFFAPAEADALAALPPEAREAAFVRLWCAKEAVLKAHGHGLSFGLHRLEFTLDDTPRLLACDPALGGPTQWTLRLWTPEPGYVAALAWRAP